MEKKKHAGNSAEENLPKNVGRYQHIIKKSQIFLKIFTLTALSNIRAKSVKKR
jgi:hypothetical protein